MMPATQDLHELERLRLDQLVDGLGVVERAADRQPRAHAAVEVVDSSSSSCVPWAMTRPSCSTRMRLGVADGREAVRDHERRAALAQPAQRVEDDLLGKRVERRGRLVEDQDRRVLEQRPGDAETLALAARQRGARLGDERVVAVRQPLDEGVHVGGAGRRFDVVVGRRRAGRSGCCRRSSRQRAPAPAGRARCARAASAGRSRARPRRRSARGRRWARRTAASGWPAWSCRRR